MGICCGCNWEDVERHVMEQETTRKINEEARIDNENARHNAISEAMAAKDAANEAASNATQTASDIRAAAERGDFNGKDGKTPINQTGSRFVPESATLKEWKEFSFGIVSPTEPKDKRVTQWYAYGKISDMGNAPALILGETTVSEESYGWDTHYDVKEVIYSQPGGTSTWDEIKGKPNFATVATSGNYSDLTGLPEIPDVQINGTSITSGGVANIPIANASVPGVLKTSATYGTEMAADGFLRITRATEANIDDRDGTTSPPKYRPITPGSIDYAVKAAMTDGKGAPWNATEQEAAQSRLGLDELKRKVNILEAAATGVESGNPVTIEDAYKAPIEGLTIYGKAERNVSKNLLNTSDTINAYPTVDCQLLEIADGDSFIVKCEPNTQYVLSRDNNTSDPRYTVLGFSSMPVVGAYGTSLADASNWKSVNSREICKFNTNADTRYVVAYIRRYKTGSAGNPQLEIGTEATAYEPYHKPYVDVVKGKNMLDPSDMYNGFSSFYNIGSNPTQGASESSKTAQRCAIVEKGKTYTVSWNGSNVKAIGERGYGICSKDNKVLWGSVYQNTTSKVTFTASETGFLWFVFDAYATEYQLERGSVATPYVPYGSLAVDSFGKNLANAVVAYFGDSGQFNKNGTSVSLVAHVPKNSDIIASLDGIALNTEFDRRRWYGVSQDPRTLGDQKPSSFRRLSDGSAKCNSAEFEWVICQVGTGIAGRVGENWQIELGTQATAYEPYHEVKNDISLTDVVGVTLSNGVKDTADCKRIGVVDLGTLAWSKSSNTAVDRYIATFSGYKIGTSGISNRFEKVERFSGQTYIGVGFNDNGSQIIVNYATYGTTTLEAFKAAMSGVLVYYELANPITTSEGLASASDTVRDELNVNDVCHATLTKRVGVVDLGSMEWIYSAANKRFYSSVNSLIALPNNDRTAVANILCSDYRTISYDELTSSNMPDMTIGGVYENYGWLSIRNIAYTDSAAIKNALSGVLVYYELAEPYEIELADIAPIRVNSRPTTFYLDSSKPTTFDINYIANSFQGAELAYNRLLDIVLGVDGTPTSRGGTFTASTATAAQALAAYLAD